MPRAERRLALCVLAAAALALRAGGAAAIEKKRIQASTYVDMPTLTASIVRPEGGRGVLTVSAGLDAPDDAVRDRATLSKPRLVDAYSTTLRRYASTLAPRQPPDLELLGRSLQQDTDRVLGRPGARFLFGAVLVN